MWRPAPGASLTNVLPIEVIFDGDHSLDFDKCSAGDGTTNGRIDPSCAQPTEKTVSLVIVAKAYNP
jgi:hypothetical protein